MNKGRVLICMIFCFVSSLIKIYSYPTGAPSSACSTMTPSHGVGASANNGKFVIVTDKEEIRKGENVTGLNILRRSDVLISLPGSWASAGEGQNGHLPPWKFGLRVNNF